MCQFFSAIITPTDILYKKDTDSHEEIVKENNLKDDTKEPNFVRVEIIPQDGDIFNHKIDNWKMKVDQDLLPKWFENQDRYEKSLKKILQEIIFKECFLIDQKIKEVKDKNIRWMKNSSIENLINSKVGKMLDSSQVGEMWDSSQVGEMWDSSQVGKMCGSSQVGEMWDSSQVGKMLDSSQVGKMCGSSQVRKCRKGVLINSMKDHSVCNDLSGEKQIIIIPNKDAKIKIFKEIKK